MNTIIRAASRLAMRPTRETTARVLLAQRKMPDNFLVQKKWAHNFPLTYDLAREKIMLVLHLFDKIDPNKLNLDSHFYNDLGLDSLDHVEVIMMLEDEFNFEIPDRDAEHLMRPSDILRYITDKEEAYKELQDLQAASHHHHHDHHEHGDDHHKLDHAHNQEKLGTSHTGVNTTQTRSFCSWSYTAKRYFRDTIDPTDINKTSFGADPSKKIKIEDIQERVMKVCSKYDKIDSSKLELSSHFVDDLGLDSLDHVEIMMELEDEFGFEIPDKDAEKLLMPIEIAKYIFHKEEARLISTDVRPY